MPIVPLYGHDALRSRLRSAVRRGTLPASLLIHGPRGIGKQRLALWLGQLLLCESAPSDAAPCGTCRSCRYVNELGHPDLHWYFPRPRLKDTEPSLEDVKDDFVDALRERLDTSGVYAPPSGLEGIFIRTVHLVVQQAGMTPTIGNRKVFVIGDADRMVAQEGSDQAANAFLKLLEEPLANTTVVLTTSEPATLLPTIRSRVIGVRATPLSDAEVRGFLKDPLASAALQSYALPKSVDERVRLASGAPGALLTSSAVAEAVALANAILAAPSAGAGERFRLGLSFGSSRARGFFSEVLDALTSLLHDRVRERADAGDDEGARRSALAVSAVEEAKLRASGNVSPQLIGSSLLRQFAELRP
jgi:DNA polymerase III subunit delta'